MAGKAGLNFLTPAIAFTAWREVVHRELNAVYDIDRFRQNLLSSQPAVLQRLRAAQARPRPRHARLC
jgi:hypothetical protein